MMDDWMDRSLNFDKSFISVSHFLSLSVNIEEVFNLPNHGTEDMRQGDDPVETAVVGNNLRKRV